MKTYIVTHELRTPIWFKVLRFLKLKQPMSKFKITLPAGSVKKGEIITLNSEIEEKVKLIR